MQFTHPYYEIMYREFNRQVLFTEADWHHFEHRLRVKSVGARHTLQEIGKPITHHHFIVSGLVRWFYVTPEGKELNKGFYGENTIAGNLSAVILNEPSRFAIATLEPCELVSISTRFIEENKEYCASWERLFNHSCKMLLVRNERREAELLTLSPRARYRQFVKNFRHYQDRIPQYHVASYLGINPVSLSKFKHEWLAD